MPTQRQRKAVLAMAENGGIASPALKKVGYSKTMYQNPQRVTRSPGFKEALEEYGLTDELIKSALVEDIKGKPLNRAQELSLAARIRGLIVDKKEVGGPNKGPLIIQIIDSRDEDRDQDVIHGDETYETS